MRYGLKINNFVDGPLHILSDAERAQFQAYMASGDEPDLGVDILPLGVMDSALVGEEIRSPMILDAIVVVKNRLERKMQALQRALNTAMAKSDSGISVGAPEIGTPRKNGLIATLTVRFPMSDGQAVSVVFHAPDGDPEKVTNDDTLISFQWKLNTRDVTQWMSPEADEDKLVDIALNTLGSRVQQLVEANTAKFTARREALAADKAALEAEQEAKANLGAQISDAEDELESEEEALKDARKARDEAANKVSIAQKDLGSLSNMLEELQVQVAEKIQQSEANGGSGVLTQLATMGLTAVQLAVMFVIHTTKATYRKDQAFKMGIENYELIQNELIAQGKYVTGQKRLTQAGTNLLHRIFGEVPSSHRSDMLRLLKGENLVITIPEQNRMPDKLIGSTEADRPILDAFLEKIERVSGVEGWDKLRFVLIESFSAVYQFDAGNAGDTPRSKSVQDVLKAIKVANKSGHAEAVALALEFIEDFNDIALKPFVGAKNAIWDMQVKARSIYEKKYGFDLFKWSLEGTQKATFAEFKEAIDNLEFRLDRFSGHTSDEFQAADVRDSLVEVANDLIRLKGTVATDHYRRQANALMAKAESMVRRWMTNGGAISKAIEDLNSLGLGDDRDYQLSILEKHLYIAEEKEVGPIWDAAAKRVAASFVG